VPPAIACYLTTSTHSQVRCNGSNQPSPSLSAAPLKQQVTTPFFSIVLTLGARAMLSSICSKFHLSHWLINYCCD
jgi:hypothetical protein